MPEPKISVTGKTNNRPNSEVELKLTCPVMWSLGTQFAYDRLSNYNIKTHHFRLIENYEVRARRIAGTYARFYLETEQCSKPDKKGRFYWAGLAAFASKTVASTMEFKRVRALPTSKVRSGLGKGNLWLFMDIAAIHWYWAADPASFQQCAATRPITADYVAAVRDGLTKLDWYDPSFNTLKQLPISPEIIEAFDLLEVIDNLNGEDKPPKQLEHLLAVAVHEQKNILQPLIYDDPDFSYWIKVQRVPGVNYFAPELKLVFTHKPDTDDPELESKAPVNTQLENYDSRMIWIKDAAEKYHWLMRTRTKTLEDELATMAEWVHMPDTTILPNEVMPE